MFEENLSGLPQHSHDLSEERLRLENDLLKLKLKAEFGAELQIEGDLSPRLQHIILQQVYHLEQATHRKVPKVTVYNKIGSPPFTRAGELADEAAPGEVARMMALLRRHHIILDILASYDAKTIYSFITEEFFPLEIDDFPIGGWCIHYCYEDFHPNHDYDLRNCTILFIEDLMDKELDEQLNPLHREMISSANEIISKKEAYQRIRRFYEIFSSFRLNELQVNSVSFDTMHGLAQFDIDFDGVLDNGEKVNMSGEGEFHFMNNGAGGWSVRKIEMPGLRI